VQHEREPFGGGQRFQHHEQGHADRVSQHRLVFRTVVGGILYQRFGQPAAGVNLATGLAGPQHVQADPPDHRGQPAAQVADAARVAAAEPQPRLLHRVLGFADRAEHAVGDRLQVLAVLLELPGQPVLLGHCCHPCTLRLPANKT